MLINGDDILFPSCQELHANWVEKVRLVGFKLSVGKSYLHPSFLTANSEGWICTPSKDGSSACFRKLGSLNPGLLYSGRRARETIGSLGERADYQVMHWTDKLETCLKGAKNPTRTWRRAVKFFGDEIARDTRRGLLNVYGCLKPIRNKNVNF